MAARQRRGPLAKVMVSVHQPLDSVRGQFAAYVGQIFDVTPDRPPAERMHQRDVVIPVGDGKEAMFKLPPGEYLIQAIAPGGDLLDQRIAIDDVKRTPKRVKLGKRRSLSKRLGWQANSGNIDMTVLASEKRALLQLSEADRRTLSWFGHTLMALLTLGVVLLAIGAWVGDWLAGTDSKPGAQPVREAGEKGLAQVDSLSSWNVPAWLLTLTALGLVVSFAVHWLLRERRAPAAEAPPNPPAAAAAESLGDQSAAPSVELEPSFLHIESGLIGWALVRAAAEGRSGIDRLLQDADCKATRLRRAARSSGFDLFEIPDDAPFPPPSAMIGRGGFALIPVPGLVGEIVTLPLPWHLRNHAGAVFEIAVSNSSASSFATASTIRDAEFSAILGYLSTGRLEEAGLLVRQARDLLSHKIEYPLPAALGAYVLLRTCTSVEEEWSDWISNLCHAFPRFADGAILHGWNLLQQGSLDQGRASFLEAYKRGVPTYSEGIRMLQEGLSVFADGSPIDPRLKDAIEGADLLARRCNPRQAFTTIRIAVGTSG